MKSNDLIQNAEIREAMQKALRENDTEGFTSAFDQMLEAVAQSVRADFDELRNETDARILANRGVRQLTSEERKFYQSFAKAVGSPDPKQALTDLNLVLPETTIDAVFDDLTTTHPLLSKITFIATNAKVKLLMNTNGDQRATWGELTDKIIKELTSGFKEVDSSLLKLSAFLPVAKSMLDLGPTWLDRYVRDVLYEALANGLEYGYVTGDGNKSPIGMIRQVGDNVTVTGGVYPKKVPVAVKDFKPETVGNLLALLSRSPSGKDRAVEDVILLVNPQDYYRRVMPATTVMAPDGTYRRDVMPFPMTIIPTAALNAGEAVFGMAKRYFATSGIDRKGNIEYSDHYQFLEDNRVYLIKTYANGMALDDNAFLYLDLSGLEPLRFEFTQVSPAAPSDEAALADLKIGNLTLAPAFAGETTSYTAATTAATNTVSATPKDAGAEVEIKVGSAVVANGKAATWETGENTLTVKVTAADGTTTKTYTVTVTKS